MKTIHIAWDAPVGYVPTHYVVSTDTLRAETYDTEYMLKVHDAWNGKIEVRAADGLELSEPCAVWYEEFALTITVEEGRIVVAWPCDARRMYCLERINGLKGMWEEVGTWPGNDAFLEADGGDNPQAFFRVWSVEK